MEIAIEHKLVDLFDRARGAVFNGQNTVAAFTRFDSGKYRVKGGVVADLGELKESLGSDL